MLSAQDAIKAARALQANERDALREAGRKKLEEYRKLKAALRTGDSVEAQLQQRSFSNSNPAAAGAESSPAGIATLPAQQHKQQIQLEQAHVSQPQPQLQQQSQAQHESVGQDGHDPMVDVLLAQVGQLMSDKQKLTAQCSSLQRENEQLVELVGYLSIEQQQLLEQQHQLHKVLLNVQSGELLEDGTWSFEQELMQKQQSLGDQGGFDSLGSTDTMQLASSDSSMEAVYMGDMEM